GEGVANSNPVLAGKLTRFDGQPASLPGAWGRFRGGDSDGISKETVKLAHKWQSPQPRELKSSSARACAAVVARVFQPGRNGVSRASKPVKPNTSFVTETKGTLARSWTGCCSSHFPIGLLKALP